MKALLEKIRKILRSRRTRQLLTRVVSCVAAIVVFITTYALVLPAITMEQDAFCGISEHQHTDACYEERLVCEIPEGEEHHHDASCYEKFLICGKEVHTHSAECYQKDSSAVISSGSGAAASTALEAFAEPGVYETGVSEFASGAVVMDSAAGGESVMEEFSEEEAASAQEPAEGADEADLVSGDFSTEGTDGGEDVSGKINENVSEAVPNDSGNSGNSLADTEQRNPASAGYSDRAAESGQDAASGDLEAPGSGSSDGVAVDPAGFETEDTDSVAGTEEAANDAATNVFPETAATAETMKDTQDAEDGSFKTGTLTADGDGYKITLDYTEEAKIPENAELSVREITAETDREAYEACLEQAGQQVAADEKTGVDQKTSRFFDIEILVKDTDSDGKEETRKIEPSAPVSVNIQIIDSSESEAAASGDKKTERNEPAVLHFAEEGVEQIDSTVKTSQEQEVKENRSGSEETEPATEISFEAESFSIYGVVYTVDFHWDVNGKTYEFSIPGGGFVSFYNLVESLGIEVNDPNTEKDEIQELVDGVESIEFSNPELVSVSKAEEDITVGEIKDRLDLVYENSAELKEEALEVINASKIRAGDWALISLKPFSTEESLTITMTNGESFVICVTDEQLKQTIISADGNAYEITVTYFGTAQIPDGAELKVREILKDDEDYREYLQNAIEKAEGRKTDDIPTGIADEDGGDEYADNPVKVPDEASGDRDANVSDPTEEKSVQTSGGSAKTYAATAMMPGIDYARFFDIQIWADGQKVEPKSDVYVTISLADVPENMPSDPQVVHFVKDGAELVETEEQRKTGEEKAVTELSFTTDGFSVFAVIVIDDYNGTFTLTGEDFKVKITYTEAAELPLGTVMTVRELEQDSEEFLRRLGETWAELNHEYLEVEKMRANYNEGMGLLPEANPVNVDAVRFFDISFAFEDKPIEPKVPVQVEITYDKGLTTLGEEEPMVGVAHFAEEGLEMIEDIHTALDEAGGVKTFRYEQRSFSDTGTYVARETRIEKAAPEIRPAPVLRSAPESGLFRAMGDSKGDGDGGNNGDDDNELHISHAPHAEKTLTPNDDGTYKLALNVTGEADTTALESVTKSNVLIVMDRSSSMVDNYVNDGLQVTQVATTNNNGKTNHFTPDSGTTYYGRESHNEKYRYFPLTYTNDVWYCENFSYTSSEFNPATKVYKNGGIYTGTVQSRMTEEQSALSGLIYELLEQNMTGTLQDGTRLDDIIEVSVISFGSQRFEQNQGGTEIGWTTDYEDLMNAVNKPNATSGTNWEDALMYAKEVADAKRAAQPNEEMYVIFLTDGEPTAIHGETSGAVHYNNTGGGFINAYKPATDDARALVDARYHLYGIYTFNNIGADYLQRLIHVAYGEDTPTYSEEWYSSLNKYVSVPDYHESDNKDLPDELKQYFYDASDPSGMADAFQNILSTISNSVAFGRVSIVDGITTDAATTAVVSGSAQGFRYSVKGALGELYSVTTSGSEEDIQVEFKIGTNTYSGSQVEKKTGTDGKEYYSVTVGTTEYKMALATIDDSQKVTWDLSAIGTLMGGYTYSVEFDVWPNQAAYDYVADLNNGMREWDTTLDSYKDLTSTKGYEIGGVEEFPSIVRYPNHTFSVLTNTEQVVTYSIVKTQTVNGETTTTYDGPYTIPLNPPDPMELMDTRMSVEKIWDDDLDKQQLEEILYNVDVLNKTSKEYKINLLIWKSDTREALQTKIDEGNVIISRYLENNPNKSIAEAIEASKETAGFYKNVIVGWDNTEYDWDKDFTVAPGLMVPLEHAVYMGVTIVDANKVQYNNETYYVLDPGHYYTITEPGIDRHYELNTPIYHPMIVGTELKQVTIENGVVVKSEPLAQLDADNTIKGGINVRKLVKDADGTQITNTDDTFSVTLTMMNKDGTPYTDFDYRIFYGENNPKYANTTDYPEHHTGHIFGTADAKPADNQDEQVTTSEPPQGKCHIVGNEDGKVTFELYVGDTLRVINIPTGVTYSVTENVSDLPKLPGATSSLYTFEKIDYEIAKGSGAYQPDSPNNSGMYSVKGNSASCATVVNKIPSVPMRIVKIGQDGENKPLGDIWFKLYYDVEGERQILEDSIGTPLGETIDYEDGTTDEGVIVTDEDGNASLGRLIAGDYYLKEIKTKDGYVLPEDLIPITISKVGDKMHVSYNQAGNSLSQSGNGVIYNNDDPDNPYFSIVIANYIGVELPATGGPGTSPIYLLGIMLTGLAGAGLVMRRKRKAA